MVPLAGSDSALSKRILVLFIVTTVVLILQGIYNIYSLDGVNKSITQVYDSVDEVSSTSKGISLPISELRQLSMSLVMAPSKELREELKTQVIELIDQIDQTITNNTITFAGPREKELFDDIRTVWLNYASAVKVTLGYVKKEVRIAGFISVTVYEKKAYDSVTAAIVAYNAYQLQISAQILKKAQDNARIAFWAVLITTLIEVITLKVILAYVLNLVRQYVAERKKHSEELQIQDEALIKSEKMASLGRLVAGVAHEINTSIGIGITASSHLSAETAIINDKYINEKMTNKNFGSYLDEVIESSLLISSNLARAAKLVMSFKQVAVDQSSKDIRAFKLKEYTDEVLQSLKPKFRKTNIEINLSCDDDLTVTGEPGAFAQIITNLIVNSLLHGFESITTGHIDINISLKKDMVRFVYSDSGKGISKEHCDKVFDPFFTTKRGQGGSGLGLHIVYNLVVQSLQGSIKLNSAVTQGCQFIIEFPLVIDY
jgi:signal transduction histidine kinase